MHGMAGLCGWGCRGARGSMVAVSGSLEDSRFHSVHSDVQHHAVSLNLS